MSAAPRLLPYAAAAPDWNMAVDRALLEQARGPLVRFYGWDPFGISLGHFQTAPEEIAALSTLGLPLVRRMTGGGAIVHARELTYALLLPLDHPLLEGADTRASYARLHAPIAAALEELGVPTHGRPETEDETGRRRQDLFCFARRSTLDLLHRGRKLVGSAQRRSRTHLLQHGSILLRHHPAQRGTAAVEDAVSAVPPPEELAERATAHLLPLLPGLEPGSLTEEEAARAEILRSEVRVPAC